jgi:hypothetical protein
MRSPFNTTCDIFKGPGSASPGSFVGTFPCRYVREDGIFTVGNGSIRIPAYLTIEGYEPVGFWEPLFLGVNPYLSDLIAVPSGTFPRFWIIYTDIIIWHAQAPYYRGYLAYLPYVPLFQGGGLVFGGQAVVSTIPPFTSVGGLVFGGQAVVSTIPPFTSVGGLVFGGQAVVSTIPPFTSVGGLLFAGDTSSSMTRKRTVLGDGGILFAGDASWFFTPGSPFYVQDHFTDPNGTALTSHTPNVGGPWLAVRATMQIQSNSLQANTFSGGESVARIDTGHTSYIASMQVTFPIGTVFVDNIAALLFRTTDRDNSWYAYLWNGFLYLECFSGGVNIHSQFTACSLTAGVPVTLLVTVDSSNVISVSCGASGLFTTNSTFSTITYIGAYIYNASSTNIGTSIDDFEAGP